MRALARPVSGADDALTSITCGRPAPYGAASYGGAAYGGAAYGEGVSGGDGAFSDIWEYERDPASGSDGADGTGGANGTRGNGRDGATRQAQVILLAAADPANAYGAPCRGLRSRTRRRAATGPAGRRERWSSWPTAS
jgi:hypothetical protein